MDSEVAVQVEARNAWIKGMMKEAPLYEVGHQIFRETDHYRSSLKVWKENHLCVWFLFRTWISRRRGSWLDQQESLLDGLWHWQDWSVTAWWNSPQDSVLWQSCQSPSHRCRPCERVSSTLHWTFVITLQWINYLYILALL